MLTTQEVPARIRQKFEVAADGCWTWRASRSSGGYGNVQWEGRVQPAHRVMYRILVGEIPRGLCLDHLCRNRACVNPAHLEPVTGRENTIRGETLAAANTRKTHCPHGHAYTADNTLVSARGKRSCRACSDAYRARWRAGSTPGAENARTAARERYRTLMADPVKHAAAKAQMAKAHLARKARRAAP